MGSLPDLHALTREEQPCCRPGSHLPQCCHLPLQRMSSYSPGSGRQSSISSVRRLIAVVRSTPSRLGPTYSRRLLCRNFAALCLGHATATAALAPLLALHGSSAARLLAILFTLAALSSAAAPLLLRSQPPERRLLLGYCGCCLFFGAHLYPRLYTLLPAYLLMGIMMGPLAGARITLLMTLASKLYVDEEEETGERVLVVQRLLRGLRAAHDLGLVAGNSFASLMLWHNTVVAVDVAVADDVAVVCGSVACPDGSRGPPLPCRTDTVLAGVFLGCCVTAVALTGAFTDRIEPTAASVAKSRDALKRLRLAFVDPRLRLAAPLSLFVGLEQGFMYADFTESYVVCALGIDSVPMVFLSLGVLQSIAGFTLSMLLQHVRRYLIIGMGCAFHSCLLMVLLVWKPAGDDPALFYVIAAAWGVCNAVWDTLSFGLVMSAYPDSWQAPVAHSYFFRFSGLAVAFGLHGFVCNRLKLYGLAGAMVLAVAPYTWMEMKEVGRRDR